MPRVPLTEIELRASRSSGPGGQHANKTESRIEAVFVIADSQTLTDSQKERLTRRFGSRITAVAQDARSQSRNRELAVERVRERIASGLRRQRARQATRPSRSARERRLADKRRRGERKRDRRRPMADD